MTLWDKRRNVDILEETGELPIEEQLRQKRLQWFGHLQRVPDHRAQKQLLRCRPNGKKRRPGGTSLQWVDLISRDLNGMANCVCASVIKFLKILTLVPLVLNP